MNFRIIFRPPDEMERYSFIKSFVKTKNGKWLDAGCSECNLEEFISNHNIEWYGVDLDKGAIEIARKRGYKVSLGGVQNLNFKDNFFNGVICTETLEHIKDDSKAIVELIRVVKDGGFIIITSPNKNLKNDFPEFSWLIKSYLKWIKSMKGGHVRDGYTFEELENKFKGCKIGKRKFLVGTIGTLLTLFYFWVWGKKDFSKDSKIWNFLWRLSMVSFVLSGPLFLLDRILTKGSGMTVACIMKVNK